MGILLLIFVVFTFAISIYSYTITAESLDTQFKDRMDNIEKELARSAVLVNLGLRLYDITYDTSLKNAFVPFLAAYSTNGDTIEKINLSELKKMMSPDIRDTIELYIINADGRIIASTYQQDIGLEFSEWPDAYQRLTDVRLGSSFQSDRVVKGTTNEGSLRKFAYMPTPDHRYILELSRTIDEFSEERKLFSYMQVARVLIEQNPQIIFLHLYNSVANRIGNESETEPYKLNTAAVAEVNAVLADTISREVIDDGNKTIIHYIYLDVGETGSVSASMMNLVAEIQYSTEDINRQKLLILLSHLFYAFFMMALAIITAYLLSRVITLPIQHLVSDVNRIADGNLDNTIRVDWGSEFAVLQTSLNKMVSSILEHENRQTYLKEVISQLRSVIEYLPVPTMILTKKSIIIGWNRAMEEFTGISQKDCIGQTDNLYRAVFYENASPLIIDYLIDPTLKRVPDKTIHQSGMLIYQDAFFPHVKNKEGAYLRLISAPLLDKNGILKGAILTIEDQTDSKNRENDIKEKNKKLHLLSSITRHDILNQVTRIIMVLEEIQDFSVVLADQELREYIDVIDESIRVIHDLILFTRQYQEIGVMEPFWQDIEKVIESVISCIDTGTITIHNTISGLTILADPLFKQVIYNLIENAVRHGQVVTTITFSAVQEGDLIVIICEDDGIGIESEDKERIFEQGYGKNTGLGMYLITEVLSITGISIRETGIYQKGARFEMVIKKGQFRMGRTESLDFV